MKTPAIRRVGLVSRTDQVEALRLARGLHDALVKRGVEAILESEVAAKLKLEGVPLSRMDPDLLVVIGGDGTILRAAKTLPSSETPILGVKMGKTCFLGEVDPHEALRAIELVLAGHYELEENLKLRAIVGDLKVDVVNEVLLMTGQPAKVVKLKVEVEGEEVFEGLTDGVIVSTPTGSTGYALSAHGPIIDPKVEAYLMVYLNPLNLGVRPLIVAAESVTTLRLEGPGPKALLIADGEVIKELGEGSVVEVRRSPVKARFVRLRSGRGVFYSRLKDLMRRRGLRD